MFFSPLNYQTYDLDPPTAQQGWAHMIAFI